MSTDINLLLHKDEETLKRKQRVKILYFIAVVFLLVTGAIPIVIFLLIQATNVSSIKKEQADITAKISEFQDRETKLSIAENRISNISEILEKRKDLFKAMNGILLQTPDRLLIRDIEISDKSVIMTAQSTSLDAIGEFINNLTDMVRKKEVISSLTLNSLMFEEGKNSYEISIKSDI